MRLLIKILIPCVVVAAAIALYWFTKPPPFNTNNPLLAKQGPIDLLADLDTNDLPEGWAHRKFLTVKPADYRMTEEDGVPVLRCSTNNSASILARDTEILLSSHSVLSWRWKVTTPIVSDTDESTKEGDDHPIRFFITFSNENSDRSAMEIIWSNKKYQPGDYKIIGDFYHYVANGLDENTGKWFKHTVDLKQIYKDIGGTGTPTLQTIGFFCDSDNTGSSSDAVFANIALSPQ